MLFVYLHVIWFGCWIGFRVEHYPFGLLTMIVSLEAIFLSTFVMISQNRADARRQVIADQQWKTVQDEDEQNQELLETLEPDSRTDEGHPCHHDSTIGRLESPGVTVRPRRRPRQRRPSSTKSNPPCRELGRKMAGGTCAAGDSRGGQFLDRPLVVALEARSARAL